MSCSFFRTSPRFAVRTMPIARGNELVYATVDDVVVPAGTALGEKFTAKLWAKQRGVRVAKAREFWRASGTVPCTVSAQAVIADGPRHAQRPSAIARREAGLASAQAIDYLHSQPCQITQWQTAVELPFELHGDDVGWVAGPVNGSAGRPMPAFTGRPSGAIDSELTSRSSARRIMRSVQFTRAFKQRVVELSKQHTQRWAAEHSARDGVEMAFDAADLQHVHVELWFAIALRVAKLNPAIAAERLWDATHHCYDREVATACSYLHWQWLNRHLSFGAMVRSATERDSDSDSGSDSDSDGGSSDGEAAATATRDRYRSRRVVSDMARAQAAKAFRPGQHLGFDDLIRVTRHADGRRVRHKAAVHTGRANDGLNDAQSHYFLWWEEQGWTQQISDDDGSPAGGAGTGRGAANSSVADASEAARPLGRQPSSAQGGRGGSGRANGGRGRRASSRGRGANDGGRGTSGAGPSAFSAAAQADADMEDAASDTAGDEAGNSMVSNVSSVTSRLQRACSVLRADVGHCLWLDRGMASFEAMRWASDHGFYISAVMQANRIGLPRRFIASLKKSMTCPKACKHSLGSNACKRWCWTVLHKGQWELELWCDGTELVILLSNCTSATRMMTLSRSVGRQTRQPLCPGGVAQYNIFGRGPTDTGDQHRRRLSLSNRRRLRQGTKGALFDAEIGFVNCRVVAERLRATHVTVWDVADEYCSEVLAATSMRRNTLAAAAEEPTATRSQRDAHRCVSYSELHSRLRRAGGAPAGKRAKRGRACCEAAAGLCAPGEPKRPMYFCAGCEREREDCSGWYHWECYWKRHCSQYCA